MYRVHRRPFVLVIDPSPTLRTVLAITLSREGYGGISYADPVQALRDLKKGRIPPPVLAFLDVTMSSTRAFVCLRLLRSWTERNPPTLVAMSEQGDLLTGLKARLAGAHAILPKPFTCQQLMAVVSASLW